VYIISPLTLTVRRTQSLRGSQVVNHGLRQH